jgi:hypothetical protein
MKGKTKSLKGKSESNKKEEIPFILKICENICPWNLSFYTNETKFKTIKKGN